MQTQLLRKLDFLTGKMQWRKRWDFKSSNRLIRIGQAVRRYRNSNRSYWLFAIRTTCIRKEQEYKDFALNPVPNIRYLPQQALPIRGHWNTETMLQFSSAAELRAQENPEINEWLQKRDEKYTSPKIQNDLL